MSAFIDSPEGFDESKKYPAIVVTHPGGGVKQQTAGLYAGKSASGSEIVTFPLAPARKKDALDQDLLEAWEYYHTDRCQYPTAPGFGTSRSLMQIITYDAFNFAEVFLTQPLLIVAGSKAGSKWMSGDLYKRAASTNKNFHVVEGANHMSLYDAPQYVDEAVSVLAPFFKENLLRSVGATN